jgi:hypothetical protein
MVLLLYLITGNLYKKKYKNCWVTSWLKGKQNKQSSELTK